VGVVYERWGCEIEARAGREVILSAGAVATPQLLELSGIGRPEVLKAHGIEVRHPLPAVGENFRDHINARIAWRVKERFASYNHKARGLGAVGEALKYITTGGGFFSLPSAPLLAFLRTRPELASPDVQMHLVPYAIKDPKSRKRQDFPAMSVACYQLRPESLGSIHIRSADPNAHPAIRFNFLSDPIDQRAMVDGFRMMRRIVEAKPMDALRGEDSPGTGVKSDEEILTYIRGNAHTPTTRSAPAAWDRRVRERSSMSGSRCGLAGLRIADASIFPTMPSATPTRRASWSAKMRRPDPQRGVRSREGSEPQFTRSSRPNSRILR
jgi:choline dehydrogenase